MKTLGQRTRWTIAGAVSGLALVGGPVAAAAAAQNPSVATVRVTVGEALSTIAARYHTTVAGLAAANRIANPNVVVVGQLLRIPQPGSGTSGTQSPVTVRVTVGEALSTIAARYHTTVAGLAAANRIANPNVVVVGQLLRIPQPGSGTSGTQSPVTVRVTVGEALSTIAARYHTTVAGLVAANRIANPNVVVVGQLLRIPQPGSGTSGTQSPVTVRVAVGDSLSTIAARYHTTVAGLAATNRIANPNVVDVGQLLSMPGAGWAGAAGTASPIGALPSYLVTHPSRLALRSDFVQASMANDVPLSLLEAVCWWESGWQVGVVSPTGAVGVCQIEPPTAAYLNSVVLPGRHLDVHSPSDNITMAAAYLHQLLLGAGGNERLAIGAYYQGLASVMSQGLLPETRTYINGIRTYIPIFGGAG